MALGTSSWGFTPTHAQAWVSILLSHLLWLALITYDAIEEQRISSTLTLWRTPHRSLLFFLSLSLSLSLSPSYTLFVYRYILSAWMNLWDGRTDARFLAMLNVSNVQTSEHFFRVLSHPILSSPFFAQYTFIFSSIEHSIIAPRHGFRKLLRREYILLVVNWRTWIGNPNYIPWHIYPGRVARSIGKKVLGGSGVVLGIKGWWWGS